jgi:dUTP pyrophosphatase
MERIARFEKVSFGQFEADVPEVCGDAAAAYDLISMPVRATAGSAGYDIKSPFSFTLEPGSSIRVATGLRCSISDGWVMMIFPKSGLGFKFRAQLDNTVGIVDQDYYGADNEGHILVKITNDSKEGRTFSIESGKAFAQAVFVPFGITEDDEADGKRTGGFGSTNA